MEVHDFTLRVRAAEQKLFRVAYSILRNEADCADAIQEALIHAWRRIGTLREERYFDTWLVRILMNECYTIMRRSKKPVAYRPPEQPPENRELHDALMALEEKYRLPLTLYYMEGYSVGEIAEMMRLPQGTVKGRLHRGRARLKSLMESEVVLS